MLGHAHLDISPQRYREHREKFLLVPPDGGTNKKGSALKSKTNTDQSVDVNEGIFAYR
jgi:hypothetical protein